MDFKIPHLLNEFPCVSKSGSKNNVPKAKPMENNNPYLREENPMEISTIIKTGRKVKFILIWSFPEGIYRPLPSSSSFVYLFFHKFFKLFHVLMPFISYPLYGVVHRFLFTLHFMSNFFPTKTFTIKI